VMYIICILILIFACLHTAIKQYVIGTAETQSHTVDKDIRW